MLTSKDLARYRQVVEEAVAALGRDDIGVNVEDGGPGMLAVTFSRGTHSHKAQIPIDPLQTHEGAHATVNSAVLAFSKRIAQEALSKGSQ